MPGRRIHMELKEYNQTQRVSEGGGHNIMYGIPVQRGLTKMNFKNRQAFRLNPNCL